MGGNEEDRARLFSVVPWGRMRSNEHKLKYRKFYLNIRKHVFIVRVVKHLSRLLREVMKSPSLEIFKTQLAVFQDSLL